MTDAVVITPVEHPSSLDAVGDAIAVLAARLHAATYELLVLLRRFDAAAGWNTGFVSCAHWLSWRTGMRYREIQVRFSRDEGVVVNGEADARVPAYVLTLLPPVAVDRTVPEAITSLPRGSASD